MKRIFTLLTVITFIGFFSKNASSQDTIVQWTFPTASGYADAASIESNLEREIKTSGGTSAIQFKNGETTKAAQTTGWDNGMNEKKWKVELETTGYTNIKLSSMITSGGANPGPRDFKVQYRISGGDWTDVPDSDFHTANDWTTGALINLTIPSVCNNQSLINIRWIMTSDTASNGQVIAADGKSKIDNIFITGDLLNGDDELFADNVTVYPNPANDFIIVKSIVEAEVSVFNMNGQKVIGAYINNSDRIDLSQLTSGIYLLRVENVNSKSVFLQKIMIQ